MYLLENDIFVTIVLIMYEFGTYKYERQGS